MVDIGFQEVPETPASMKIYTIRIVINNPDRVRQLFNQIRVYRSIDSTDGTDGTFTEITESGTRVNLIGTSRNYTFVDVEGNADYWYRITYYNSRSNKESPPSRAQQGRASPALSVLSVDELKINYLFGVDLTDDQGTPYPDSLFQFYIESAVQFVQDKLDIVLPPTQFLDERQDYIRQDYNKYIWMQLLHRPVLSVERVRLVLPTNQQIIEYNTDWIYTDKDAGTIEIVPGGGQITLGQTGAFLPLVFGGQDYLPQAFRIDYTAGFNVVPGDIREVIGMFASLGPFNIAGDLVAGAGIQSQSISMDGLSQSLATTNSSTNAGYGARLLLYFKQLKEMWPTLQGAYRGNRMVVV